MPGSIVPADLPVGPSASPPLLAQRGNLEDLLGSPLGNPANFLRYLLSFLFMLQPHSICISGWWKSLAREDSPFSGYLFEIKRNLGHK